MAAALVVLWLAVFGNSFRIYMPTGRFFLSALVPIGYLWYRGFESLFPPRTRTAALALMGLVLFAYNLYLIFHVFPPLPPMPFDAPFTLGG